MIAIGAMWIFLGALINPDALLPYAVMVGGTIASISAVWPRLAEISIVEGTFSFASLSQEEGGALPVFRTRCV